MKRKQVQVGIIGLGKAWERDYRPALLRMSDRIVITAVNDCIPARANQVAVNSAIIAMQSMTKLAQLPQLQAVLLLESGWRGRVLLPLALQNKKSVFLVEQLGNHLPLLKQARQIAEANDLSVVPEFTLRYTPASCRLQELLATALGEVTTIHIKATVPVPSTFSERHLSQKQELLVDLFDWCQRILARSPSNLLARTSKFTLGSTHSDFNITIEYPATSKTQKNVTVFINLKYGDIETEETCFEIGCEQGEAIIQSDTEISWHVTQEKTTSEKLLSERTSTEVMLDHFCRRLVGGLLPVADLDDIARSVKLVECVELSLNEKRAIDL